jgi:hypothetical protein
MALGAGIMAVGIIIGQIITPDIEAQNNGVFDKITCRELVVVDKDELVGVRLAADNKSNQVVVFDKQGVPAASMLSMDMNMITVNNPKGIGIILYSGHQNGEETNTVEVYTPQSGKRAFTLKCGESLNALKLEGQAGEEGIFLGAGEEIEPFIAIRDRESKVVWSAPE